MGAVTLWCLILAGGESIDLLGLADGVGAEYRIFVFEDQAHSSKGSGGICVTIMTVIGLAPSLKIQSQDTNSYILSKLGDEVINIPHDYKAASH